MVSTSKLGFGIFVLIMATSFPSQFIFSFLILKCFCITLAHVLAKQLGGKKVTLAYMSVSGKEKQT